jgi:hypothetical protein
MSLQLVLSPATVALTLRDELRGFSFFCHPCLFFSLLQTRRWRATVAVDSYLPLKNKTQNVWPHSTTERQNKNNKKKGSLKRHADTSNNCHTYSTFSKAAYCSQNVLSAS